MTVGGYDPAGRPSISAPTTSPLAHVRQCGASFSPGCLVRTLRAYAGIRIFGTDGIAKYETFTIHVAPAFLPPVVTTPPHQTIASGAYSHLCDRQLIPMACP